MFDNIKAVLFDLDGTLADSMGIWKEIDVVYLGRFGIKVPKNLQNALEGMSFTETACYFKERFALPDSVETIKADWNQMAMEQYQNKIPLKPGAASFVKRCHALGLKLGIASSNSRELVEHFTNAQKLLPYFSAITTACDAKKGKPAPDIYLLAARQLGVEPCQCLVFEDIVPGIQAGKAAGMRVCAVEDAYSADRRAQKRALADYYIDSYCELFTQLEGAAI